MKDKRTADNSNPKVAVQLLNQAFCFFQSCCLVGSEVLRKHQLLQQANPYKHI